MTRLVNAESISIHVLREEDDCKIGIKLNVPDQFQSTSSARRTTSYKLDAKRQLSISIHVLREEDDRLLNLQGGGSVPFQSTSSARRTTTASALRTVPILFQSTSSARRTTPVFPGCQLW